MKRKPKKSRPEIKRIVKKIQERQQTDQVLRRVFRQFATALAMPTNEWGTGEEPCKSQRESS